MPKPIKQDTYDSQAINSQNRTKALEDALRDVRNVHNNPQIDTFYAFTLDDPGMCVEAMSDSPTTFFVTADGTLNWEDGAVIEVCQMGQGTVTLAPDSGVQLLSDGGSLSTAGQYATIGLRHRAPNMWIVSGDLGDAPPPSS